jgi:hypothetical protein
MAICKCLECQQEMDAQQQADGKGGSYTIITCWNPDCGMRTVTRSLASYSRLTADEIASYREMNRKRNEMEYAQS